MVKKTHRYKFLEQALYELLELWGDSVAIRPLLKVLPLFSQLKRGKTSVKQFFSKED